MRTHSCLVARILEHQPIGQVFKYNRAERYFLISVLLILPVNSATKLGNLNTVQTRLHAVDGQQSRLHVNRLWIKRTIVK